jgi:hypothetical protein
MQRRALVGGLLLGSMIASSTVTVAAARSRPDPVCNLLVDAPGDGHSTKVSAVSSPALDVLSGDVATGRTSLVAVLRLASTDLSNDVWSNAGYHWKLTARSASGAFYMFRVYYSVPSVDSRTTPPHVGGSMLVEFTVDGTRVPSDASDFKVVGNTFVWTIKKSAVSDLARPKNVLSQLQAETLDLAQQDVADSASSDSAARYPVGAPSCVNPA